jgi:HEAT repeat protein
VSPNDVDSGATDPEPQEQAPETPYGNLWVPLIVIPFLVVGVIVLVYAFFGGIAGTDATMRENLARLVEGGPNERGQAATSLAAQIVANFEAQARDQKQPYEPGPGFDQQLQGAWERLGEKGNPNLRLVIAQAMALRNGPDAVGKLTSFLGLPESEDPRGEVRHAALFTLGQIADPAAAPEVIPFLNHELEELRIIAASALQRMPSPQTNEALRSLLGDPSLKIRGTAALSLSILGDDAGVDVLRDMLDPDSYAALQGTEAELQMDRVLALRGLGRLGFESDRREVERMKAEEADPVVREAAMRALANWGNSKR